MIACSTGSRRRDFFDTGGWFAQFVKGDQDHARAVTWMSANTLPLVTTDYIVDELLTLLRARGERVLALRVAETMIAQRVCRIEWISPRDFEDAIDIYCGASDKNWSFTDCTSFAVMRRLSIRCAFAFDAHFRQVGTLEVVP